ncbi:MAG: Zn-dependent hydrolase [Clostridia bacterium]|nr:Zn-dependent hydrolase [Clostridia bacterium]
MKKTYITSLPNKIGALLQATKCFSSLDINITRVSYNKAVDSHTLFIEVQGDEEKLLQADAILSDIGYLNPTGEDSGIILIEFLLKDVTGSATILLELIEKYGFNISYISSQEAEAEYQMLRIGLRIDNFEPLSEFLSKAEELCRVKIVEYNKSERSYDNSFFYKSFVQSLIDASGISQDKKDLLLINTNLAMEILDTQGLSPYRTFDCISKFAELIAVSRGESFSPRITTHKISEDTEITVIEPPCGSNTIIIKSLGHYLFVDTGYAYYKEEMLSIFRSLIPDFDSIKKTCILTHLDVDHTGLLPMFDEVYASRLSRDWLIEEFEGRDGIRERNGLHTPYIRICKTLTEYTPADPEKMHVIGNAGDMNGRLLAPIGFFPFGELEFEVYEGGGGHLPGEIVLIDYKNKIAFTGDIYVNIKGMTPEQKQYNQYAPILTTGVDTNKSLCAKEREAIFARLGAGKWNVFGAHGPVFIYETQTK